MGAKYRKEITDEVREELLAKDPKKQRMSMLQRRSQMKSLHSRRGNMSMNSQVCIHIRIHICTFICICICTCVLSGVVEGFRGCSQGLPGAFARLSLGGSWDSEGCRRLLADRGGSRSFRCLGSCLPCSTCPVLAANPFWFVLPCIPACMFVCKKKLRCKPLAPPCPALPMRSSTNSLP